MSARIVKQLIVTDKDGDMLTVAKSEIEPSSLAFHMGVGEDVSTVYVDRDDALVLIRYVTRWLDTTAPQPGDDDGQPDAPPTPDDGDPDVPPTPDDGDNQ